MLRELELMVAEELLPVLVLEMVEEVRCKLKLEVVEELLPVVTRELVGELLTELELDLRKTGR